MTDRLYYTDPYLQSFDATVVGVERHDNHLVVALDRTAFYPTSGGQPFDTGVLGTLRVVDVVDRDDGSIAHLVEPGTWNPEPGTSKLQPGMIVRGAIDWPRRFDHMQQHTGQHVLSAAFDRLFGVRTVSFHLGAAVSTIDLAREVAPADIATAEAEANRIVWEDRPVAIRFVTAEEAARLPLRKEPVRGGTLRLIDVEQFDLSACGGTHVARTGGIGIVAVASWERFKGGQRIEFLCGGRALGRWRTLRDTVASAVRQLSVLPEELPAAIERLQVDAKEQRRSILALQSELARFRAGELAATAEEVRLKLNATGQGAVAQGFSPADLPTGAARTVRLVARALDADASELKAMATTIVASPGFLVVLVSLSQPLLVVVARSAHVNVSAQQLLSGLVAKFGGRGGGKPDFAQGGGLVTSADEIISAVRAAI
jgi:alanyl-tRNA synthetase